MANDGSIRIPIIVSGVLGKMGRSIVECALKSMTPVVFDILAGLERLDLPQIGVPLKDLLPGCQCTVPITADIRSIDAERAVLIEFSPSPGAAVEHCAAAAERGWGVVIGTTGLEHTHIEAISACALQVPVVCSPNMSTGVNLLFKLAEDMVAVLGDRYDVEIIDIHHRMKRDAPSGTAVRIAEILATGIKKKTGEKTDVIYGRQPGSRQEQRVGREIAVHSVRAGEVVGEHTVVFAGAGERLEIRHSAGSREAFSNGALRAAEFVLSAQAGLYSMRDVLGV